MSPQQNALLLKRIKTGASVQVLAEVCGLTRQTVAAVLHAMHDQRLAYVTHWCQDALGRWNVPVWKAGGKEHTPRPTHRVKSKAAVQRAYRERKTKEKTQ